MAVCFIVRFFLVENNLVGYHEFVAGLAGGCSVAYFGAGCHCSVDDYEVGFVVVKYLL